GHGDPAGGFASQRTILHVRRRLGGGTAVQAPSLDLSTGDPVPGVAAREHRPRGRFLPRGRRGSDIGRDGRSPDQPERRSRPGIPPIDPCDPRLAGTAEAHPAIVELTRFRGPTKRLRESPMRLPWSPAEDSLARTGSRGPPPRPRA